MPYTSKLATVRDNCFLRLARKAETRLYIRSVMMDLSPNKAFCLFFADLRAGAAGCRYQVGDNVLLFHSGPSASER